MAHFARLDENNIVTEVIVVSNGDLLDENGNESEQKGIEFCQSLFGNDTKWIQTSYNSKFRKNFAGIGCEYLPDTDVFRYESPFKSWIWNNEISEWEAPIKKPDDGEDYYWIWNEDLVSWIVQYNKSLQQVDTSPEE